MPDQRETNSRVFKFNNPVGPQTTSLYDIESHRYQVGYLHEDQNARCEY